MFVGSSDPHLTQFLHSSQLHLLVYEPMFVDVPTPPGLAQRRLDQPDYRVQRSPGPLPFLEGAAATDGDARFASPRVGRSSISTPRLAAGH
jgi:hypothetical protein